MTALAQHASAQQTASTGSGQDYPSRPVRVIVPYTPGDITDLVTRIVAQEISKGVGQTLLVDNRPGANSILDVDIVSKASPDGYTIGAAAHLTTELLMLTTGIKMTHVPYKGTAPALQDLIGGQIQVMMDVPSSILNDEVYKWGKVIKQAGVKIEG